MSESIKFYSVGDEYGEFSNFAPYPIFLNKKKWPTSEHYFQAQKFLDPKDREEVRKAAPHTSPRGWEETARNNFAKTGSR